MIKRNYSRNERLDQLKCGFKIEVKVYVYICSSKQDWLSDPGLQNILAATFVGVRRLILFWTARTQTSESQLRLFQFMAASDDHPKRQIHGLRGSSA
jgi:hypothetical protein